MTTIEKYRQHHRIDTRRERREAGWVNVCRHDGLRVHQTITGKWYHDRTEVREAAEVGRS